MSKDTPLRDAHAALGAQFTDFAGWSMPVRYTSDLAEHAAVRERVGVFDLSHMGELHVAGPDAAAFLDAALAGRYSTMPIGRAKYALLLNEHAGIIDDLIVYRLEDAEYLIVENAGNTAVDTDTLTERAERFNVTLTDQTANTVLIAVQGPLAASIVTSMVDIDAAQAIGATSIQDLGYYRITSGTFEGQPVLIARTGYTGEDGFELYLDVAPARTLWQRLVDIEQVTPCGLACRDTLRLEAGMPLYGHELNLDTTPWQAGLGRVVVLDKADSCVPDNVLSAAAQASISRRLVGMRGAGRRAARAGYSVVDAQGETIGAVTSGALSPTLGDPIAMGYIDTAYAEPGNTIDVDVRGKRLSMTTVALPFYHRPTTK